MTLTRILFLAAIPILSVLLACEHPAPSPALTPPAADTRIYAAPASRPATFKVAAIQFRSQFGEPEDNRKRLTHYIRTAAANGAQVVVLPETAISGYTSEDFRQTWQAPGRTPDQPFTGVDAFTVAETVPGDSTNTFSKLAAELGIYLTVPFVERSGERDHAKYFNTIVLLDPKGKIALHYRKLNPWLVAESGWATPGDLGHAVVDTPYGRLGLLVCYDINFEPPALHKLNVDTLLYCIAWVDDAKSQWFYVNLPAIAKDNNINIVGANWTVNRPADWFGYGHSLIIARDGNVLQRASGDLAEEIVYAELPVK